MAINAEGGKIVVVDDDPGMNQAIERLLNAAGYQAMTFASAEDLLQTDIVEGAACLVLDIHLPGLSGFELQRRLATSGVLTPVIFITAYDEPEARLEAARAGASGYFTKPFSGRSLVLAISSAINSKNKISHRQAGDQTVPEE